MRFIKCIVILSLCLLMVTCEEEGYLDIDIGDYEAQLAAWNSQNMLDYQMRVNLVGGPGGTRVQNAVITVRNGIPESSNPPEWITNMRGRTTVPEFYFFIKEYEGQIRDSYEESNDDYSLKVRYNPDYYYPCEIEYSHTATNTEAAGAWSRVTWTISVMPLEEGELDIDIGDYENQLEAWNSQNMLDYQIEVTYRQGHYGYNSPGWGEIFNIRNGIPDVASSGYMKNKGTIEEIYSSIKEEEEMTRNEYNGINRSYFNVRYNTVYHYPVQISYGFDHLFGRYYRWEIVLTPNR